MTKPAKRGRGRPPLSEGESVVVRRAVLPESLDAEAARIKGRTPWAEWLRGLVEDAVRKSPRR